LTKLASLNFEQPDPERFSCIALAYRSLRAGGTLPAAMNAANEEAVHAFIDERIGFSDIPRIICEVMDLHETAPVTDLESVLKADAHARELARQSIGRLTTDARVSVA
jgi:1-deoxy-D-xylulose-5-phosphate reductoisomerase